MPEKGTVAVLLTRAQAHCAAEFLLTLEDDRAQELGGMLAKAAKRKRPTENFTLHPPRELAQWFAPFTKPGGWWEFGGVYLEGQEAPEPVRAVAVEFLRAVSRRKGRRRHELQEVEGQLDQFTPEKYEGDDDRRVRQRLEQDKADRAWEREQIATAGSEPEA